MKGPERWSETIISSEGMIRNAGHATGHSTRDSLQDVEREDNERFEQRQMRVPNAFDDKVRLNRDGNSDG